MTVKDSLELQPYRTVQHQFWKILKLVENSLQTNFLPRKSQKRHKEPLSLIIPPTVLCKITPNKKLEKRRFSVFGLKKTKKKRFSLFFFRNLSWKLRWKRVREILGKWKAGLFWCFIGLVSLADNTCSTNSRDQKKYHLLFEKAVFSNSMIVLRLRKMFHSRKFWVSSFTPRVCFSN